MFPGTSALRQQGVSPEQLAALLKASSIQTPPVTQNIGEQHLHDNSIGQQTNLTQNVTLHLPSPTLPALIHNLPTERNRFFTGRTKELESINERLKHGGFLAICSTETPSSTQAQLAISGGGGFGKSQLVKEYAHRVLSHAPEAHAYQLVWWINAKGETSLLQDYKRLAEKLQLTIDERATAQAVMQTIHEKLDSPALGGWLRIYDDLYPDNRDTWFPHGLPARHTSTHAGHILITSRSPHFDLDRTIRLGTFTNDEAMQYLDKLLPGHPQAEKAALATLLGNHPLALTQAGGYIKHHRQGLSIPAYRQLFNEQRQMMLGTTAKNKTEMDTYQHTITTTVQISLQALKGLAQNEANVSTAYTAKLALNCLELGSMLAPGFVPMTFYEGCVCGMEWYHGLAKEMGYTPTFKLEAVLAQLEYYGLIVCENKEGLPGVSMHEVVQYTIAENLSNTMDALTLAAQIITTAHDTSLPHNPKTHAVWEMFLPHARRLVEYWNFLKSKNIVPQEVHLASLIELCDEVLRRCSNIGQYQEKVFFAEQSLTLTCQYYRKKAINKDIALSLRNLATAWSELGEHRKAIPFYEQALSMQCKVDGALTDNAEIASTLNNLGIAHRNLREFQKAIHYLKQALAMKYRIYGIYAIEPDIAVTLVNLGNALGEVENRQGAISCLKRALEIHLQVNEESRALGDIATIQNGLGSLWLGLGKYWEALLCFKEALELKRRIYGKDNGDIAIILLNIAFYQLLHGHYEEVRELCEYSKELLDAHFSPAHPNHQKAVEINKRAEMALELVAILPFPLAAKDWGSVRQFYDMLLKLSPACNRYHHNLACYLHIEALEKSAVGAHKEAARLKKEAMMHFKQALAIAETAATLVEFAQFLYLQQQPQEATSYLQRALKLKDDGSTVFYNNTEASICIPLLQKVIAKSAALGNKEGEIILRPTILAYTLRILIHPERGLEYFPLLKAEVTQHPSPVHYDLLVSMCHAVSAIVRPHVIKTLRTLSFAPSQEASWFQHKQQERVERYQTCAERLWQARRPVSEERQKEWKAHGETHQTALKITQRYWRNKVQKAMSSTNLLGVD